MHINENPGKLTGFLFLVTWGLLMRLFSLEAFMIRIFFSRILRNKIVQHSLILCINDTHITIPEIHKLSFHFPKVDLKMPQIN